MDSIHGNISTLATLCSGALTDSNNLSGLSTCDPLTLCATHDTASYQNALFLESASSVLIGWDVAVSRTLPTETNKGISIKNQGATISADNSQICIDYTPTLVQKDSCIFINFCWLYYVEYPNDVFCNETVIATYKLCFNGEVIDNLTITNEDGSLLENKICSTEEDDIKITPDITEIEGYKVTPQISIDGSDYVNAGNIIKQIGLNFAQCQQAESGELTRSICEREDIALSLNGVIITTTGGVENIPTPITNINEVFDLLSTSTIQFECIGEELYANGEVVSIGLDAGNRVITVPFTECENPLCFTIDKSRLTLDREYCFKFIYTVNEIEENNMAVCDDLKVNIDVVLNQSTATQQQLKVFYGFSTIAQSDIVSASITANQNTYTLLVSGNFTTVQPINNNSFDGVINVELTNGCIYQQSFSVDVNDTKTLLIQGM